MACAINPAHPGGFLTVALIAFLVVLVVLPALDKLAAAFQKPVG